MASKSKSLELKTRVGVEGETTYKQSLNSIASSLKVMKAEMAATQSAFGANADSMEALTAKQKALQEQQEKHAEKVKLLKEMLELAKKEFGENSAEADEYRVKVANAETALNKCTSELNGTTAALDEMGGSAEEAGDDAADAGENLDDLGDSAEEAGKDSEGFGEKLKNVASIIGSGLAKAAEEVAAAFMAIGSAAAEVVSAGFDLSKSAGTFADDLLTLSTQTGISTQTLQEWSYSSNFIDTSVETMTGSMRKMIKNMGDAAGGSEQAQEKFNALGVSIVDADGNMRSAEDVFMDCIDALGQIENPIERDAAAMELFGKSAQELNPLIEAGSAAFRAMGEEAHDMGVVFSDEALAAMGSFDDSMQRLTATGDALKTAIGAELIPAFQPLVDTASGAMADINKALQDGFQPEDIAAIGQSIASALEEGIATVTTLLDELGPELGAALGSLVETATAQLPDLVSALLPVAESIISGLMTGISDNAEQLGALAGDLIARLAGFLTEHAPDLVNAAGDILGGLIDGLTSEGNLAELVTSAVTMIGRLAAALVENAGELLARAPEILAQLWEGLRNVDWAQLGLDLITGLYNGLKSAVSGLLESIKGIFVDIWHAILGVFGIHSPSTEAASAARMILDGLLAGFEEAVGAVCDAVKRIFGKIWDAIKSIFGFGESEESKESKQAGKDIMSGIKEGITGGESDAQSAVKDAAKKILDTMKSELGAGSGASQKTRPYGESLIRGINEGLGAAQASQFTGGANAVFSAVTQAVNGAFGVAGTGLMGLGEASAGKFTDLGKAVCKAIADGISGNNANTDAVKEAISQVATAAYEAAAGEMAKGIGSSGDSVNEAVQAVADGAVAAAADILTQEAGEDVGDEFTGGIEGGVKDAQSGLLSQVDDTADAVIRAMEQIINEQAGATAGQALGEGLRLGMQDRQADVRGEAERLAGTARDTLFSAVGGAAGSNFTAIGSAISEGVATGISGSAGRIAEAARRAAQAAYNAAAKALGINSPSRVMKEIGEYYDQGFAEGIQSGMRGIVDGATQLSRLAAGSIQTTRSQAERIDYDRLGEATAQAMKRAGIDRPMLAVGKRVLSEAIEPNVSQAAQARASQSVAGRSARMVMA